MSAQTERGSDSDSENRVLRTVTPPYWGHGDAEMTTIGWGYFLALLVLLVPLLPFLFILWLADKLVGRVRGRSGGQPG